MALSQKHRSSIYLSLVPVLGTEDAEALLQEFPSNDLETPATKDFVRAEVGMLRSDFRAELAEQVGALRTDMHKEFQRMTLALVSLVLVAMAGSAALYGFIANAR